MRQTLTDRAVVNGKYTFTLAWERANKYKAIPLWARTATGRRKILKMYVEAQIRNLTTKRTKYQLDHIVPLYHPDVCGLHCAANLQILTKQQNEVKTNYFVPYAVTPTGRKRYYKASVEQAYKQLAPRRKYKCAGKPNPTKKNPRKLSKKRRKTPILRRPRV